MLMNFNLHKKSSEVCIKARSTLASPVFKGLVTEHRTVKWSIPDVISLVISSICLLHVRDSSIYTPRILVSLTLLIGSLPIHIFGSKGNLDSL